MISPVLRIIIGILMFILVMHGYARMSWPPFEGWQGTAFERLFIFFAAWYLVISGIIEVRQGRRDGR